MDLATATTIAIGLATNLLGDGLKQRMKRLAPALGETVLGITHETSLHERFQQVVTQAFGLLLERFPQYTEGNQWMVDQLRAGDFAEQFWQQYLQGGPTTHPALAGEESRGGLAPMYFPRFRKLPPRSPNTQPPSSRASTPGPDAVPLS